MKGLQPGVVRNTFCLALIPPTRSRLAEERGDLSFRHTKEGALVAELLERLMSCRFLPMSCWLFAQAAG